MAFEREYGQYGGYRGYGDYDPNDPFGVRKTERQQSQTGASGPSPQVPSVMVPRQPAAGVVSPQAPSRYTGSGVTGYGPGGTGTPSISPVSAGSAGPDPSRPVGVATPSHTVLQQAIAGGQLPLSPYSTAYGSQSPQAPGQAAAPPRPVSPTPNNVVPPPSQGGPPAPYPSTMGGQPNPSGGAGIPHSGNPNDPFPGYTFVQGRGWVENRQLAATPGLGTSPFGADDRGRPTYDNSLGDPLPSSAGPFPQTGQPATAQQQGNLNSIVQPPGQGAGPGMQTITNDVGDVYTIPAEWGPYRGQMRGYSTANYDARGSYANGSGEFGRQLAVAKIVSHIDPKDPQAHQKLEAAMSQAGLKFTRLEDGTYSFSENGKPNQPGVHLLKNGQWTWIDHGKMGGGMSAGTGGGMGGGFSGVGSYGADGGVTANGQPNFLDPTSAGNQALLQWILNGAQGPPPSQGAR